MSDQRPPHSVRVGDLVIEPVERVVTRVERLGDAVVCVAVKEPVAVVFRTPDRTWRVELEDLPPGAGSASGRRPAAASRSPAAAPPTGRRSAGG